MEPTEEQIKKILPHVRYEIESLLQLSHRTQLDSMICESVAFRRMAHGRALRDFFTKQAANRKWPKDDDVLAADFGFKWEKCKIYEDDGQWQRMDKEFNKRLFHITYSRIEIKRPWAIDEALGTIESCARKFIDHIIETDKVEIEDAERHLWIKLRDNVSAGRPFQQNTGNVPKGTSEAFEIERND